MKKELIDNLKSQLHAFNPCRCEIVTEEGIGF